ncbi:MAG: hypothetical protein FWH56_00080 [Betaproteobacteria bacterium]|nr:hypothetical protein [Betaproteobacteria bacterium]
MYRGNDSVFRFSLTGIAFFLIFFLLILFVRMSSDVSAELTSQDKHPQTDASPEGAQSTELSIEKRRIRELEAQQKGITELRKVLTHSSRTPVLDGTSEEALISALELRARLEQALLSAAPPGQKPDKYSDAEIASRVQAAIDIRQSIESLVFRELGVMSVPGQESAWEQWLLTTLDRQDASGAEEKSDPRALRAQIAFLRERLDVSVAPPCWFDAASKVQPLLAIELHPGRPEKIAIKPLTLPRMHVDSASVIPGLEELQEARQMPYPVFKERARTIAQHSSKQWCRYSVQVTDHLRSGMQSERIHRELENFFHLVILPR